MALVCTREPENFMQLKDTDMIFRHLPQADTTST